MAVTGLMMVGYLLVHSFGNLKVFFGAETFNHYAEWLKQDFGYPLIPHGWFIWAFRALMLAAIVLHIWSAAKLTQRAHAARGSKYANVKRHEQTYAARTMRWGGVIVAAGLLFHLLQFTTQTITTGFQRGSDPYSMFVASFSLWWITLGYLIWVTAVAMHLRHGVWSSLTTLGANTSKRSRANRNIVAWIVAVGWWAMAMVSPLAVFFGWVG